MKSLEIVNEELNDIKELGWCDEVVMDKIKFLETIKQDLEILEIIRKKKVNVGWLMFLIKGGVKLRDIEQIYPKDGDTPLTLEELLKLKQWLEVNENGKEEN